MTAMESFRPGQEFPEVTDGLEPVVLHSQLGMSEINIPGAKRQAIKFSEGQPSNGKYRRADVEWRFPNSDSLPVPRLGDRLVDSSDTAWTILEVRSSVAGSRWVCTTRNLSLSEGLRDVVTIQRAIRWEKGRSGDAQATWEDYRVQIPARIQPMDNESSIDQGRIGCAETHLIYLAETLELFDPAHFRVVGPAGERYEILSHESAERIDALGALRARRLT